MTVGALEKILSKIQNKRMKVTVDKSSLSAVDGCWTICAIKKASEEFVYLADDDGFVATRADGTERGSVQLVIRGEQ